MLIGISHSQKIGQFHIETGSSATVYLHLFARGAWLHAILQTESIRLLRRDISGLHALRAALCLVAHLLVFGERLEAVAANLREVGEKIVAPIAARNWSVSSANTSPTSHPDRWIVLDAPLSLWEIWDGRRLQQLLGNLVVNAIRYGAHDTPVRVVMTGNET